MPFRLPHTNWLMVLSMSLLVMLQALWLRTEYRSGAEAFRRETNLVFRSTIHQIADSLLFHRMQQYAGSDSVPGFRPESWRYQALEQDSADGKSRFLRFRPSQGSSAETSPAGMRHWFSLFEEGIDADSLLVLYRRNLPLQLYGLPVSIIQLDGIWGQGVEQQAMTIIDSLDFVTYFMPAGRSIYAAKFDKVPGFLVAKMAPQLGFSILVCVLIALSFFLTRRSLRMQKALLARQNDFIGNISHELKTPLATVGVALEALRNFDVLDNKPLALEYMDMASHELSRLQLMTEKILRTSVFDYLQDIMHLRETLDLYLLSQEVIRSLDVMARNQQSQILLESGPDDSKNDGMAFWVKAHPDHITQVIYNLLDNALKYAGKGSLIKLTVQQNENHVLLSVCDNGPGIAAEHHARVFEKFYRVQDGNIHNVKGYGLGLHYVMQVVKAHGGSLMLNSKPDSGAEFIIRLPRADA